MLFNIRREFNREFFNLMTKDIKKKLRIKPQGDSNFTILTQLCSSDINMYLIAMASFCRFVVPKKVIVVADRLTNDEVALLAQCIEGIHIIPIAEAGCEDLPSGGCWERLISIHKLIDNNYVVQLDADTITLQYPDEVVAAINGNRSFTLPTKMGQEIWTLTETADKIASIEGDHVQLRAEKSFSKLASPDTRLYVRGCAGFAGFAKGSAVLEALIDFNRELEAAIGKKEWNQWGSEQVASNYVIANTPHALILPFSKYPYYEVGLNLDGAAFVHFIGGSRYKRGVYMNLSRQLISQL